MRNMYWLELAGLSMLSSCAVGAENRQPSVASPAELKCDIEARQALIVHGSSAKATSSAHRVVAPTTVKFIEARYVEGPCADEIVKYVSANGTLASGQAFALSDQGQILVHENQGLAAPTALPARNIQSLIGYNLVMVQRIRLRRSAEGERAYYIGLFRGRTDSVIARFDVVNGEPSREAEPLIRSRRSIDSIDFLGAPDWPAGWIGLVEQAGRGEARLYSYRWDHGDLRELKL